MPDWGVFFIGIAIIALGIYLVFRSFGLRAEMRASLGWPSVQGEVTVCELQTLGGTVPKNYDVRLTFKYTVAGNNLEGHMPHLYGITKKEEAETIVNRFPAGSTPRVFYDPRRPERGVLVTGERPEKQSHEFWMGVIVAAVGAIVAWAHLDGFMTAFEITGR